jgi:hypothetical protein
MAICALSPREVDRFNSARAIMAGHTNRAVEWFADDTGAVLGGIAFDQDDLEWSLVVLWRDHQGRFHAVARDTGLPVLDDARRLVIEKMTMALATDDQVSAARAAA